MSEQTKGGVRRVGGALGIAISLVASTVRADRREASLHLQAVAAATAIEHDAATARGDGATGGLAVRASYATRNAFQYDAQLTLAYGRAWFDAGTFALGGTEPTTAPFWSSSAVARVDGGVTLRLGVRWIPTVRLAAGAQVVRRGSPVVMVDGVTFTGEDTAPASLSVNLVGTATVGLDYRVGRRMIVGASVGTTVSVPGLGDAWHEAALTLHVARYWYPRW